MQESDEIWVNEMIKRGRRENKRYRQRRGRERGDERDRERERISYNWPIRKYFFSSCGNMTVSARQAELQS